MSRWLFKGALVALTVANAWLFMGIDAAAELVPIYTDTCGCVYGGGGGGPSGPGTPTCFDFPGSDCEGGDPGPCGPCAGM